MPLVHSRIRRSWSTGRCPVKAWSAASGTAPANHNYRFELEFESEELRQKWIASAGHERVWPPVERAMKTLKDYPVVLYDEV